MELQPHQINVDDIRALACEALNLLAIGQFGLLVERYGYATALGRKLVDAVRTDLAQALSEASGSELLTSKPEEWPVVLYQHNDVGLLAAIDCLVPSCGGRRVLISFVVTGGEGRQCFTLEDICEGA
jgi:hypothetical protein